MYRASCVRYCAAIVAAPFFTVPRSAVTMSPRSERSRSAWSIRATHTQRSFTVAWSTSPIPAATSSTGTTRRHSCDATSRHRALAVSTSANGEGANTPDQSGSARIARGITTPSLIGVFDGFPSRVRCMADAGLYRSATNSHFPAGSKGRPKTPTAPARVFLLPHVQSQEEKGAPALVRTADARRLRDGNALPQQIHQAVCVRSRGYGMTCTADADASQHPDLQLPAQSTAFATVGNGRQRTRHDRTAHTTDSRTGTRGGYAAKGARTRSSPVSHAARSLPAHEPHNGHPWSARGTRGQSKGGGVCGAWGITSGQGDRVSWTRLSQSRCDNSALEVVPVRVIRLADGRWQTTRRPIRPLNSAAAGCT